MNKNQTPKRVDPKAYLQVFIDQAVSNGGFKATDAANAIQALSMLQQLPDTKPMTDIPPMDQEYETKQPNPEE